MPAGDDVRLHGWDGEVTFLATSPFIPQGQSVWEMGVSMDPEQKANEDFRKRSNSPGDVTPCSTTFVFVTPHVWAGRKTWEATKRTEDTWRDVKTIDGSVLATWLERAPAVGIWIADALGRTIRGLHSIDRYWNAVLVHRYAPNITETLIIGGRDSAREQLVSFLRSPSEAISLIGETAEEPVLFALAVCRDSFCSEQLSRLLVLSDVAAIEHLATLTEDHVVLLSDPGLFPEVRSSELKHIHIVIPEKRDSRFNSVVAAIDLNTLGRDSAASAIQAMGYTQEDSDQIARDSKGSLQAILWMLSRPDSGSLAWASGRTAAELAPLVIAGQWMANSHPDHEVIAQLAQRDYSEVKQTIAEWSGPGKPLNRNGAFWDWKAWGFAWSKIAHAIQNDDIHRFLRVSQEVLGAIDPALELPPEERWLAGIRGKVRSHSSELCRGLAQSIVLLAINGESLPDSNGQAAANEFVGSLLQIENPSSRWISIAPWLPDLAEAAPDSFLDALEHLVAEPASIEAIFTETGMFGSSPHTHVLWALERLAWSEDHLGRAILALGKLDSLDPGGSLMNRPSASLRMLMLPCHPATGATVADRISGLRLLFGQFESTAWRCAASLLPQSHDTGSPFARPMWRAWAKDTSEQVTLKDYWEFQEDLVSLLLEHAGAYGGRWAEILDAAPRLWKSHSSLGQKVVDAVLALNVTRLERADSFTLGESARALVLRHQAMPNAEWAVTDEELEVFKRIAEHVQPDLCRDRFRWLFAAWPKLAEDYGGPYEERATKLRALRHEAVSAVLAEEGMRCISTWAEEVGHPESLGETLSEEALTPEQEQELLSTSLASTGAPRSRPPLARLASSYISTKSQGADLAWRQSLLISASRDLGTEAAAYILQSFPFDDETTRLIGDAALDVQDLYWRQVRLHPLSLNKCEEAAPKLLEANQHFQAIHLVAMLLHGAAPVDEAHEEQNRIAALARLVLSGGSNNTIPESPSAFDSPSYEINRLLDYLESHGSSQDELARLEFRWLSIIWDGSRRLKALQMELSESPVLFGECIKLVYRREDGENEDHETDEDVRNRAVIASRLLESWTRIPGLSPEARHNSDGDFGNGLGPISPAWIGEVDGSALSTWVNQAVDLGRDSNRETAFGQRIGRQFAYAPADHDGIWPCSEVRRVIESASNDNIDKGLFTGVLNRRGAHFAGRNGIQEQTMAMRFREWCERVRLEYPRTGTILRQIAERYESEAAREIELGRLEEFRD